MSNPQTKGCGNCKKELSLTCFHRNKHQACGYSSYCKNCRKENAAKYYIKNKEKINSKRKEHYENNKEKYLGYTISRRYNKEKATPNWDKELTDFVIKEAYELAKIRKKETGIEWHVDHIIPLSGKEVSGLNVWNNIQLLPAKINLSKGNRYGTA